MTEPNELSPIVDLNREILTDALNAIDGPKVLVWDPTLIKRFNLIATTEQLRRYGVISMLQLELIIPGVPKVEHNHVVYVLSSASNSIKKLCACLVHAQSTQDRRLHHALIVPDATFVVRETLKQQKNALLKTVESLPIRLYPIYDDVFTMLMDDIHVKLLLNNDWTELQKCASAIRQAELLAPSLPNLRCKGKWAAQVVEIVKKMRVQHDDGLYTVQNSWNVSDVIIIDRWIDPLTPFLMQLTYAGLIDELFNMGPTGNIKSVQVNEEVARDSTAEISLHDELFAKLRDLHIKDVGKNIGQLLNSLREERNTLKENRPSDSLAESKVLVRKLLDMQACERHADVHTQIAGRIMNSVRDHSRFSKLPALAIDILQGEFGDKVIPYLEDLMIEGFDPFLVIRFIILQCLVCGGFKSATYVAYQRQFTQCYGGYYVSLWIKLQLLGILYEKNGKAKPDYAPFDFQQTNRRLSCITNEVEPELESLAYPYNGYVPSLVRHIEIGLQNHWREWTSVLSDQPCTGSVLIFVIGGLTLAELASLAKIHTANKPVIATTALITANKLLKSVLDFNFFETYENVARKVEQMISEMTKQLIVNAESGEDIEVELKLKLGKSASNKMSSTSRKKLSKVKSGMLPIWGSFNATAKVTDAPESSSSAHSNASNTGSSERSKKSNEKRRREADDRRQRRTRNLSLSKDVISFGGFNS